jgi:hypothetical protein
MFNWIATFCEEKDGVPWEVLPSKLSLQLVVTVI